MEQTHVLRTEDGDGMGMLSDLDMYVVGTNVDCTEHEDERCVKLQRSNLSNMLCPSGLSNGYLPLDNLLWEVLVDELHVIWLWKSKSVQVA